MLISIFGGIKGNYRWLIFNQAVWDFLVSHNYTCANISYPTKSSIPCFYNIKNYFKTSDSSYYDWLTIQQYIIVCIENNPYSALLLLTISRMFALYFPYIYGKLTDKHKMVYTILVFNLAVMIFDIRDLFHTFRGWRIEISNEKCYKIYSNLTNDESYDICMIEKYYEADFWYNFCNTCYNIFTFIMYVKPLICLVLSTIAAGMIGYKIAKQAKFQMKNNQKDFIVSLRISGVIILQTIINIFVFFVEFTRKIPFILAVYFNILTYTSQTYNPAMNYTGYLDLRLPLWFDGPSGLADNAPRQMIRQIRVFIESIIILFLMSGYREAGINFIKFLWFSIMHLQKSYKKFWSTGITHTKVTTISSSR
uniref:G-protein coupled receptors family 1 profile domain-containing protein n=1 Tax=Panagrolaimus davidi TaxID=227884 RepID=A0A914PGA8_9BILA